MDLAPDPTGPEVGFMEPETYVAVLDRIYDLPGHLAGRTVVFVPTPEQRLERIRVTREFLDRVLPRWRDLKVVHVGGTSGKGSTAWMLASMITRRSRTGLVTSPHLFDLRERIRVDLEPISREDLVRVFEEQVEGPCRELIDEDETFALRFPEVILATAFAHFLEVGAEWAVVEVALGGRYDQTNVVEPAAAAITNVSYDHTQQLGDDLADIAAHKAGIIKFFNDTATTEIYTVVLDVIRRKAEAVGASMHTVGVAEGSRGNFRFRGREWNLRMRGPHQRTNAALALSIALDVAGIPEGECQEALSSTLMPARFQEAMPGVFADVAHNPAKVSALAGTIREELAGRRTILVIGIVGNKDHPPILQPLVGVADGVVFTRSRYRGGDPDRLLAVWRGLDGVTEEAPAEVVDSPREALERAQSLAGEGGAVVVTGSTFVVDEALNPEAAVLEANALYLPPGEVHTDPNGARDA
jgi:dihydrofolate synthase/folylpolyglutamate synthase